MIRQMQSMTRPAFHPLTLYPELDTIQSHFTEIRAEALKARESMTNIADSRVDPGAWQVLPLLVEEEDRAVFPLEVCLRNRVLVPRTAEILASFPDLEAYAISALGPGGHIRPHRHSNPFVTAALCLQSGGDSYIVVGGERRDYHDGEALVFDYTLEHEVVNNGEQERIVLLVLLDNRLK